MEEKEKPVLKASKYALAVYYAIWLFWLVLPLWFTLLVVPDVTGFMIELGYGLPPITSALIKYSFIYGVICTAINIGFPLLRFFAKRDWKDAFSYQPFYFWVVITNLVLVFWTVAAVFRTPMSIGLYKMGH